MKSCIHNGEVVYITKLEDFRDCMEDSVFSALEEFVEDVKRHSEDEGYERALNEEDLWNDDKDGEIEDLELERESLLDEVSELEDKTLVLEAEKNNLLKAIDNALKDFSYTNDKDELIERLESLL